MYTLERDPNVLREKIRQRHTHVYIPTSTPGGSSHTPSSGVHSGSASTHTRRGEASPRTPQRNHGSAHQPDHAIKSREFLDIPTMLP